MVLRHRDFALVWLGQLISKLGSQFNYVALAWLMLQTTGSALATGGVYLAQILPAALLGWGAGVVVDRSDRRRLMLQLDLARAVLVATLPLAWYFDALHPAVIYVVTFAVSTLSLIFFAAEKAALPHLVPAEDLTEANAYAEMTEQAGAMVGPALAGVLIALLASPVLLLLFDAVSFGVSALTLMLLRWRDQPEATTGASPAELWSEIRAGLEFLWSQAFLRRILLTATAINFLAAPFTVVFPVLSERTLHAGSQGFGYLMGGIGAGMLLGSLATGALSRRLSPRAVIYLGLALLGVGFGAMALTTNLLLCVLLAALAGFGVGPANAVILTLVSQATPERLQGRVFASLFALVTMAVPLGTLAAAPLLDRFGPEKVLAGMGLGTFLTALLAGGRPPTLSESPDSDESRPA